MKRTFTLIASTLVVCATLTAVAQGRRNSTPSLDSAATLALITALDGGEAVNGEYYAGEYDARALYTAIIEKIGIEEIGDVQPFVNILAAEEQHIAALVQQCTKYGVPIPEDPYSKGERSIDLPDNLDIVAAAELGIEAEISNVAMYDALLPDVRNYPSLVKVFSRLQAASEDNHLPAFEAAAEGSLTATQTACIPSGVQKQLKSGACLGTGTCPMDCQLNCGDCPKAGTAGQLQKRNGLSD